MAHDEKQSSAELNEWQIAEIKKGIVEADAGNFATTSLVESVIARWMQSTPTTS